MLHLTKRSRLAALAAGLAVFTAACGGDADTDTDTPQGAGSTEGGELSGDITIDGSSTVAPLSEAAAELFQEENPDVRVVVGTSGTGGGFELFCAGETDISDASRQIKDDEIALCEENGIEFEELTVANDGLAVVVNVENDWAECLTVEQLGMLWGPDSTVSNWNELDPSYPDVEIGLFGPGTDSGTFDYFTDEINGEEGASRTDYQPSEDDNVIAQGIQGKPGNTGYFGLSYVEENPDTLRAVAVDGGEGCVEPSTETVLDGTYTPLGRELFIYPSAETVADPAGLAFLEFYIENSKSIAEQALYVPLSEEQVSEANEKIESLAG
ncbi:MAG: PstS family phosphate ABC transporter substrate-binding protein [Actinomycetota bacterium]|nr:PstS family phosphate ABC transporter substrate-binding protein [Actinomycetota bacterium]